MDISYVASKLFRPLLFQLGDHQFFYAGVPKRGLLRLGQVATQSQLTPKARTFYREATRLRSVAKLRQRNISVRRRLKLLQKNPGSLDFLKNINETTANFFYRSYELSNISQEVADLH